MTGFILGVKVVLEDELGEGIDDGVRICEVLFTQDPPPSRPQAEG